MLIEFSRSLKFKIRKSLIERNMKSCSVHFFSPHFAIINVQLSMNNSSEELKTSMLEVETDLWDEFSLSLSTDKQLQNDIIDLFHSQQKLFTSLTRKTHYMFRSFDALIINSSSNMQNIKNTINLQNANLQQEEQTWIIMKFKDLKKRKAMKSSQKEASINVSTSNDHHVLSRDVQVKRLHERIEFAVNQLRLAISEQKETINHNLIYIQKACNENIENSIQKQINLLQS